MKKNPFFFLSFFLTLFIVSGCSVYDFPEPYPNAGKGSPLGTYFSGIWNGVPDTMSRYAKSIECQEYYLGFLPKTEEVLKHYQVEMEKQGWIGEPSTVGYNDETMLAEWINKSETAGVRVQYLAKANNLIVGSLVVCVGNP